MTQVFLSSTLNWFLQDMSNLLLFTMCSESPNMGYRVHFPISYRDNPIEIVFNWITVHIQRNAVLVIVFVLNDPHL